MHLKFLLPRFSKSRQIYIKFLLSLEEQFIHSAQLYRSSYIILLLILFQTSEVIHRFIATIFFRMTQSDIPDFSSFNPNSTKAQDSRFHKQNFPKFQIPESRFPFMGRTTRNSSTTVRVKSTVKSVKSTVSHSCVVVTT